MDIDDKEDVEDLKEVMETLNDTVPSLISGIVEAVYNAENSEQLAKSTANFYKELVDAGMGEDKAYQLTRDFMKSRDVSHLVRETLSGSAGFGGEDFEGDVGEKIKNKLDEKMKTEFEEE